MEPTSGDRVWYAIGDEDRSLEITQAGLAHPKETEPRGEGQVVSPPVEAVGMGTRTQVAPRSRVR